MITFFTTAKPFREHDGIIQRNALKSWTLLHPDVEVILFGDDEGAAEASIALGLRHEPYVKCHESGAKQLDYIFARASQLARHDYLCYSNCDIVLMSDFWRMFEKTRRWKERFLVVGQRWDTDVTELIDFADPDWREQLRKFVLTNGFQQDEFWVDFFLFRRGMYAEIPALIVGHCYWDTWMIWRALKDGVSILDCSLVVMPVHQNHGYDQAFGRTKGFSGDPLSLVNRDLIGGIRHCRTIKSSTHYVGRGEKIHLRLYRPAWAVPKWPAKVHRFWTYKVRLPAWHFLLGVTRPVRHFLGLRSKAMRSR